MDMDSQHVEHEENLGNLRKARPSLLSSQLSLALEKAKPLIPDGGYGWVVVFATFTIYGIAEGASKSATSWIGSLFMALPLIAGPVCSALVDKFGCQKMTVLGSFICAMGFVLSAYAQSIGVLYITFGIIGGLARGLVYITVVVSVAFWFEKRRAVALGISAAGTGVGTVVFAPITAYLISEFQWRGTVLILAGFLLNMCVCGVLMIDPQWVKDEEQEEKMKKRRVKTKKDVQELKKLLNEENKHSNVTKNKCENPDTRTASTDDKKWYHDILDMLKAFGLFFELHFLLLSLGILLAGTWFLVPYFYLADHMKSNHYAEEHASFTLSAIGFANTIGMVALGWLGDRFNVAKVFAISLILCGCSIWGIMFFTNFYILLIISCASFGFFFASCFALSPALLSQLVPLDEFTMGYGLILLCEGSGHMIGPPLAGLVTDLTGSWTKSFYLAGFWVLLSGVLIGIIPFVKNRRLFGESKLISNNENNENHNPV